MSSPALSHGRTPSMLSSGASGYARRATGNAAAGGGEAWQDIDSCYRNSSQVSSHALRRPRRGDLFRHGQAGACAANRACPDSLELEQLGCSSGKAGCVPFYAFLCDRTLPHHRPFLRTVTATPRRRQVKAVISGGRNFTPTTVAKRLECSKKETQFSNTWPWH